MRRLGFNFARASRAAIASLAALPACATSGDLSDGSTDPLTIDAAIDVRDALVSDGTESDGSGVDATFAADAGPPGICPIPGCPGAEPAALPAGTDLLGVHATADGDVWAAGESGFVGRRVPDGLSGPDAPPPGTWCWCQATGSSTTLRSVWSSSSTDVYFVGDGGTVLRFDGSHIASVDASTSAALVDVWGSSASDVFVVGDGGTVRHFDGTGWETFTVDAGDTAAHALHHVWGASATDVWAVGRHPAGSGADAEIFRFEPSSHAFVLAAAFPEMMGAASFDGLGGTSASDVWAVGHKFPAGAAMPFAFAAHFDGTSWKAADAPEDALIGRSYTDVAAQPGAAWFTASGDTCVRFDGSDWAAEASSTTNLLAIDARAGRLFATGRDGKVLRRDAAGWTTEIAPTVP